MNTLLTSYIDTLVSLFNKNVKKNFRKRNYELALTYIEMLEKINIPEIERVKRDTSNVINIEERVKLEHIKQELIEYKTKCLEKLYKKAA